MALKVSLGLRGRHSKGKGKGIRARDHVPHAFWRAQIPPSPSPSSSPFNACHAGQVSLFSLSQTRGGSRIFFRRGCTRPLLYFNTNKPHSFFCRIPVVLENRRSSQGVGGGHTPCTLPLDPPLQTERLRLQKRLKRLKVFKKDSDVNESWREKR